MSCRALFLYFFFVIAMVCCSYCQEASDAQPGAEAWNENVADMTSASPDSSFLLQEEFSSVSQPEPSAVLEDPKAPNLATHVHSEQTTEGALPEDAAAFLDTQEEPAQHIEDEEDGGVSEVDVAFLTTEEEPAIPDDNVEAVMEPEVDVAFVETQEQAGGQNAVNVTQQLMATGEEEETELESENGEEQFNEYDDFNVANSFNPMGVIAAITLLLLTL